MGVGEESFMPSSKTYRRILDEHSHTFIAQGNHVAFLQFVKRYKRAAQSLAYELIEAKYKSCGVTPIEIATVCNDAFPYVVKKFDPQRCSFYAFWRTTIELQIADYVGNNYFSEKSKTQISFISFDEDYNDNCFALDSVMENDENYQRVRSIRELKNMIIKNKRQFEHQEFMMLLLTLEGYTMADFEHTGITSQSTLYLTFKKAMYKLMNVIRNEKKN